MTNVTRNFESRGSDIALVQHVKQMAAITRNLPWFIRDPAVSLIGEVRRLYVVVVHNELTVPLIEMLRLVSREVKRRRR